MSGQAHFNEVVFNDLFIADDHVMGKVDMAWQQATSELAYERSGPERFLETLDVLIALVRLLGPQPDVRAAEGLGRLVAQLHALRRMSVSVSGQLLYTLRNDSVSIRSKTYTRTFRRKRS